MKIKSLLIAAALVAAPTFASAACSWHNSAQTTSCVEGQVYDATSQSCVPISTS